MSHYLIDIGESLATVLERAAKSQPDALAGYFANIRFWLGEFEHLRQLDRGYESRYKAMKDASERYARDHGGFHNYFEDGGPRQEVTRTTSPGERKRIISRNRDALRRIIGRALDLEMIDYAAHDALLDEIPWT